MVTSDVHIETEDELEAGVSAHRVCAGFAKSPSASRTNLVYHGEP